MLVILQLGNMVKVILKCLKSWKGCSWDNRQRIANFLGTGGDSQFGKQAAALYFPQTSPGEKRWFRCRGCLLPYLGLDVGRLIDSISKKSPNTAGFHFSFLKERVFFLSVWRKHHFVLNSSCQGECHQGMSQHSKAAPCSGWGQKRESWKWCGLPFSQEYPEGGVILEGVFLLILVPVLFSFPFACTLTYVADKLVWVFSFCWRKCHQFPLLHLVWYQKELSEFDWCFSPSKTNELKYFKA